ncbi:hypothetical protein GW793_01755 [bacterium]|uniref:Uncharacterized protein n=2 Tax=Katanobacteria TaxID=422282 RepID=A0A2M7X1W3_UNCKA|nr:hypothetical protein [bacterium]PIP56790.1 MAG: hypothetical protein COX05_01180 [candidate division WWE3 bacterium CG22_combo_CG10-13_8_21_14_all_39_12]PJA40137.1 MAG: hypothetical protein CO179_03235 [candidate division WWE3 bacterium CG_4_9_14_3_um_filter_39_7]
MKTYTTNASGFALLEILVMGFVVAIFVGGYFVLSSSNNALDLSINDSSYSTVVSTPEDEFSASGDGQSLPLPTVVPLDVNSSDKETVDLSKEVNSLLGEINQLDSIDKDLNLPDVDFSLSF